MTEKSNPVSQKARDEAIRALVSRGGLTPDQISELKLDQVHLTTGTLVIRPEESTPADQPATLKLDSNTHRAIIAWLVARPDSSNNHLFPGTGQAGLDAATILHVVAAAEPAKPTEAPKPPAPPPPPGARAGKPAGASKAPASAPPPGAQTGKPVGLPEAIAKRPSSRPTEQPAQPPAAHPAKGVSAEPPSPPPPGAPSTPPQPVSLDEIEALRHRLAEVYDDWSPVVASPPPQVEAEEPEPAVEPGMLLETLLTPPPVEAEIPPAPQVEAEAPAAAAMPAPVVSPRPAPPRRRKEEIDQTLVAEPAPTPAAEEPVSRPAARPTTPLGEWLRKASQNKITLNLSYRAMVLGSLALVVVCCLGLVAVSGVMFGIGGAGELLAEATPTPTETELPPPPSPSPAPSPTATPTATPAPTDTPVPAPTPIPLAPTAVPTPTPVVIVVTATPTPTSPATATPVPAATRPGGRQPTPTSTPAPTASFKYPAPVLLEPQDGGLIPSKIGYLKWEPVVGPLAEDEWYAVRLVFQRQGKPDYEGDSMKTPEWQLPVRLFYMADGPALEYHWFVFVERHNPDGTTTQLSPESKTFTFRWQ